MSIDRDPADRRNIPQEFVDAVARGLKSTGQKIDPVLHAKVLYTNSMIEVNTGAGMKTIANPHYLGAQVEHVEYNIVAWF